MRFLINCSSWNSCSWLLLCLRMITVLLVCTYWKKSLNLVIGSTLLQPTEAFREVFIINISIQNIGFIEQT